jgi:hypothetical protein
MNSEEAKKLLELCRPGNQEDLQDPALADAFDLLESDAELRAWFDTQQAIDARISASMQAIEVPADLKANILAGMHLHHAQAHTKAQEPESNSADKQAAPAAKETPVNTSIPFPGGETSKSQHRATRFSTWIGIAAIFAIMLVFFNFPQTGVSNTDIAIAGGLPSVIQFLSNEIDSLQASNFDKQDKQAEHLQSYLASVHSPAPESIPNCLKKMPTMGCVTYEYKDTKLSMICFKDGEVYHLITADKASYPDPLPNEPETYECTDKAFRIWVEGDQVKILTVHGTKADIPEFI